MSARAKQKINTASASNIYRNFLTQFIILESLAIYGPANIDTLTERIKERGHGNCFWLWSVDTPYVGDRMFYLSRVGLVSISIKPELITITEDGLKLLRDGVIQNMVSTAYYNYRTIYIATVALFASLGAAIISIVALFK